jgi:tight adherence protein B
MLPQIGVLLAVLCCGAIAGLSFALVGEIRGRYPDPTRTPSRLTALASRLRSARLGARLAGALVIGVAVIAVTRWPVAGLSMAALVLAWPWLFGGSRDERTQIARLEALAIWTETLRDTISAHASLEQAIPVSAATAPPLLRPALLRLVGRLRARVPLDAALLRLAADLDDARSADPLIAALILHARRRGDRLADVLTGLAATARAELELRRKVLASRAELRRGVQIIIAITLGMAGYLAVFNPAFTRPYRSAIGQLALLAVVALFAAGLAWLRRLARPEPVLAFLPRPGRQPDPDGLRLVANLTGVRARAARTTSEARPRPTPASGRGVR